MTTRQKSVGGSAIDYGQLPVKQTEGIYRLAVAEEAVSTSGFGLMSPGEAQISLANLRGLHVDLFGGQRSQFSGAVNVDIDAVLGVRADITQGLGFLANGSARNMTALNPFIPGRSGKFSTDILSDAGRVLEPGGEFVVAATKGNSYVKLNKFPTSEELSGMGFDVVHYKVPLTEINNYSSRFGNVKFSQSGGQATLTPMI